MLLINSVSHFFVDAVCASALFGSGCADMTALLLLYNTLAFSTQCLVGLVTDRLRCHAPLEAIACALCAAGLLLPLDPMGKAAVVGLGNSVFHVCGGTLTLNASNGRAAPLGVFVAPGCMGLILGTLWPQVGLLYALGLLVCAGAVLLVEHGAEPSPVSTGERRDGGVLPVVLLLLAVAVRAIGGSAVSFPWKSTEILSVLAVAAVFAGKLAGGFVCDKVGARLTALVSIPLAALLVAFGSGSMVLSLTGQLLINLTMAVTLWILYRLMPDAPGFSFGLAASVLWPGTIAGQLLQLTGAAQTWCIILSFAFALGAILIAVGRGEGEPNTDEGGSDHADADLS